MKVGLGNALADDFLELADAVRLDFPSLGFASPPVQTMHVFKGQMVLFDFTDDRRLNFRRELD